MNIPYITISCLCLAALFFGSCHEDPPVPHRVTITGQMKDVMWKGQLEGRISLDTLDQRHLYGLGPLEYLAGEILVLDGKAYRSTVTSDSTMKVEESSAVKAPFFGYARVDSWIESALPDSVHALDQLEAYLDQQTKDRTRPFLFRLTGTIDTAVIHVVNLPKGQAVRSPDDAHQGQVNYTLVNRDAEILGFFSTEHKAIFTHHDTWLHLHLITTDRKQMGHLDLARFRKGTMRLFLPAQ